MKRAAKVIAVVIIAIVALIQLFRIDRTNPPIVETETLEAAVVVPADVSLIIARSCNDCHSHKTVYPWYSQIQPSAWFLRDHVDHGREHLNLSKFNTYEPKKQVRMLENICDEVTAAAMPLPSYLWLHGEAALNDSDRKTLCDWATAERQNIAL